MTSRIALILLGLSFVPAHANAAACANGISGGAACSHIELIGHLGADEMNGSGEVLNDIWGWVDPLNGAEYAIVGMQDGTAFVRLSNDGTPVFLGRLAASDGQAPVTKTSGDVYGRKGCHDELCGEQDSAWRDVKVFDHYAYIVSEAPRHGVQIFDLHNLRSLNGSAPGDALPSAGYYGGVGHAHNIFINEESNEGRGRAYVVGHDRAGVAGGLHVLDLTNPMNPVMLPEELNGDGYTHDVQCVNYTGPDPDIAGGSELCFASNEDTLTVWDVTDPANANVLSRTGYGGAAYTHQGWLSPDQQYFFLNDELDEQHTGSRTHLRVFDVRNVDAPALAADYFAPTLAIDHNNYAYGRWLYQSNYGAGLRILDVLDPLHPVEAAYFDPQPADTAGFYGTWSNFTFPSGLVAFTDINDGLYVVRPTLVESGTAPDLSVAMELDAATVDRGAAVEGSYTVTNGNATDASDVLVTLHLPAGASFVEIAEPGNWDCVSGSQGRVVLCRNPLLAAAAEASFEFSMTSSSTGSVQVIGMAYAREADAVPGDNLASGTVSVQGTGGANIRGNSGGGAILWMFLAALAAAGLRSRHVRR